MKICPGDALALIKSIVANNCQQAQKTLAQLHLNPHLLSAKYCKTITSVPALSKKNGNEFRRLIVAFSKNIAIFQF